VIFRIDQPVLVSHLPILAHVLLDRARVSHTNTWCYRRACLLAKGQACADTKITIAAGLISLFVRLPRQTLQDEVDQLVEKNKALRAECDTVRPSSFHTSFVSSQSIAVP
jgi:hypothetical protein